MHFLDSCTPICDFLKLFRKMAESLRVSSEFPSADITEKCLNLYLVSPCNGKATAWFTVNIKQQWEQQRNLAAEIIQIYSDQMLPWKPYTVWAPGFFLSTDRHKRAHTCRYNISYPCVLLTYTWLENVQRNMNRLNEQIPRKEVTLNNTYFKCNSCRLDNEIIYRHFDLFWKDKGRNSMWACGPNCLGWQQMDIWTCTECKTSSRYYATLQWRGWGYLLYLYELTPADQNQGLSRWLSH